MGKRVLIVDDALFMRNVLKDMLVKHDYEVVGEAANGADAVRMYKSLRPDVVTMDITMPDMTGQEALKAIREIDPMARVIMCSAMGQKEMVLEAVKNGASDFIVKPFQVSTVMEVLRRCGV